MTQLLRRPDAVPSLFSRGGDRDDDTQKSDRLMGLVADRLGCMAVSVGLDGEDTILGRSSRALAGISIAIFMIGLPVIKATTLVMSVSLMR